MLASTVLHYNRVQMNYWKQKVSFCHFSPVKITFYCKQVKIKKKKQEECETYPALSADYFLCQCRHGTQTHKPRDTGKEKDRGKEKVLLHIKMFFLREQERRWNTVLRSRRVLIVTITHEAHWRWPQAWASEACNQPFVSQLSAQLMYENHRHEKFSFVSQRQYNISVKPAVSSSPTYCVKFR